MRGNEHQRSDRSLSEEVGLTEAEGLLQSDPHRALGLAERFVASPERTERVRARRLAAFATRETQDISGSIAHFRHALNDLDPGSAEAARIELSLAGNFALAGDFAAAHETLDHVDGGALGSDDHLIAIQRASIFKIEGLLTEAIEVFEAMLRTSLPRSLEAHVLYNLGTALLQTGRNIDGRDRLEQSRDAYRDAGELRPQLDVITHLALCEAKLLNIPAALEMIAEAKGLAARLRIDDGLGRLDMARAFLEAGLGAEAIASADAALDRIDEAGAGAWIGEAYLIRALGCLAEGDTAAAARAAGQAREDFEHQNRPDTALLASQTGWLAAAMSNDVTDLEPARSVIDQLVEAGHRLHAQELGVQLAIRALKDGRLAEARQAAEAAAAWEGESPTTTLRKNMAASIVAMADGDRDGALGALTTAVDVLDHHRITLGATELRARSGGLGRDLIDLGMTAAFETGEPETIWRWNERLRARVLDVRAEPMAKDPMVIEGLAAVRAASTAVRLGGDQESLDIAERAVVEAIRRTQADRSAQWLLAEQPPPDSSTFVEHDRSLYRIDTDEAGTASPIAELGPVSEVGALVQTVRADHLRWLRLRHTTAEGPARDAVNADLMALDQLLALPSGSANRTIIGSEHLHQVFWSALPSLQGTPVSVTPTASILRPVSTEPTGASVVATGPGLDHANDEAVAIAEIWADSAVQVASSVDQVVAAMSGARVAHLVAHGSFRPDNPMLSSIQLDDGPLTVIDLEGLEAPPELVVLSACDAGLPTVIAGNETLGLVAALLSIGCRAVIAPVSPVADADAVPVMAALHRSLHDGARPAEALRDTVAGLPPGSRAAMLASSLVCFGQG